MHHPPHGVNIIHTNKHVILFIRVLGGKFFMWKWADLHMRKLAQTNMMAHKYYACETFFMCKQMTPSDSQNIILGQLYCFSVDVIRVDPTWDYRLLKVQKTVWSVTFEDQISAASFDQEKMHGDKERVNKISKIINHGDLMWAQEISLLIQRPTG